ncbi:MAG: YidC/Oxa1 family membrane protein insertase [Fusobacterium sp.]|nr:YidC/Oxa1 family membrane protein insertase [Fusobacterium sp.]
MDFTTLTIELLKGIANFVGNYGLAIIVLTLIIRLSMWHLNVSQQRSMRVMQKLQPKLKAIQDRYKSDPQKMQMKMMEFYKEHKFNPMGGCLPLLIQMPIFILLYTALMSPQFIQIAGDSQFLFIKRLDTTLRGISTVGVSNDGSFEVTPNDHFVAGATAKIYLSNGTTQEVKIESPESALKVQGEVVPGDALGLKMNVDSFKIALDQIGKVQGAEVPVMNVGAAYRGGKVNKRFIRESENVKFEKKFDNLLVASVPTKPVTNQGAFHWDVMALIVLFGATMFLSQKIMMGTQKNQNTDPTQQAIQKSMGTFMPIMIIGTFIIIPIPAGVLLYLVTSNLVQIVQTVIVNKQIDAEFDKKDGVVSDSDLKNAKKVEEKGQ